LPINFIDRGTLSIAAVANVVTVLAGGVLIFLFKDYRSDFSAETNRVLLTALVVPKMGATAPIQATFQGPVWRIS